LRPLQLLRRRPRRSENGRQQIQRLHETIWQQAAEIDWLLARIAELEKPKPMPAIH
jgi:hypothetical protein